MLTGPSKVVIIEAFQMLCPGCVTHSIPQAKKLYDLFPIDTVQLIGLHSVFEHHPVMDEAALRVFIHEFRLRFPIAVDKARDNSPIPATMAAYKLRGTPSLVLIDKFGRVRINHFGRLDDMVVGNLVGQLLAENADHNNASKIQSFADPDGQGCPL